MVVVMSGTALFAVVDLGPSLVAQPIVSNPPAAIMHARLIIGESSVDGGNRKRSWNGNDTSESPLERGTADTPSYG
ncbi:hypothetical protein RRSWK_03855 [Rhodopirellula sp. SWK7]|nr:hypothetical protein RRSWK_03855 [Rhodopirellula sp. SWK7]